MSGERISAAEIASSLTGTAGHSQVDSLLLEERFFPFAGRTPMDRRSSSTWMHITWWLSAILGNDMVRDVAAVKASQRDASHPSLGNQLRHPHPGTAGTWHSTLLNVA